MKYTVISKNEIDLSEFCPELIELYIEIIENGKICREIGLNNEKRVVHIYPSKTHKYGRYGIFDNNSIQVTDNKYISKKIFDDLWEKAH